MNNREMRDEAVLFIESGRQPDVLELLVDVWLDLARGGQVGVPTDGRTHAQLGKPASLQRPGVRGVPLERFAVIVNRLRQLSAAQSDESPGLER